MARLTISSVLNGLPDPNVRGLFLESLRDLTPDPMPLHLRYHGRSIGMFVHRMAKFGSKLHSMNVVNEVPVRFSSRLIWYMITILTMLTMMHLIVMQISHLGRSKRRNKTGRQRLKRVLPSLSVLTRVLTRTQVRNKPSAQASQPSSFSIAILLAVVVQVWQGRWRCS